jgi:hypothetical protein
VKTLIGAGILVALGAGIVGCGGTQAPAHGRRRTGQHTDTAQAAGEDHGRCDTASAGLEVSEYDTSGDSTPDVRRVFRRMGDPPLTRLVLACRESDLNGDGTKDVVRYYNEEGRPLREEADRNFDGTLDTITIFQEGHIVRQEIDENNDGRIDSKVYFDDEGHATRTERDLAGRSTAAEWHPDRWEYYEDGRMVRMGTDLDGDGRVDRWDRDHEFSPAPEDASTGAAATPPPSGGTTAAAPSG